MPYNYLTIGGIPYEEMEGSPVYRASRDGFSATQVYRMAWASIDAFLAESFPAPTLGGFNYNYVNERTFPDVAWLFTNSVVIEPFDPQNPTDGALFNVYDSGARVTIEYSTRPRENQNNTLQTHRLSIGGEMLVIPTRAFGWFQEQNGDFVPIQSEDVRVGKVLPTIEHSLSFEYVPDPPFETMASMIGTVNSTADLFSAQGGTLLFLGADANRRVTPQGADAWKLEYRFSQRYIKGRTPNEEQVTGFDSSVITWNEFYNPARGWWDVIQTEDTDKVYAYSDFANLFRAEGAEEAGA